MIQLRATLIQEYINKQRSFKDIKSILWKSTKTLRERIAKFKLLWEDWLYPKKSWPKQWSPYNRTSQEIEEIVLQLAKIHRFEGPIQLVDRLNEMWYKMNQSTVYRILKRHSTRYFERDYRHINRHTKRYVKELPWEEIQVDVTLPFWRSRSCYIYDAIDDCTRIVESKVFEKYGLEQSKEFVDYIIQKFPVKISAIRTDCGREFSQIFTDYCNERGILHIKNKPYTPEHNWKVERYHFTQQLNCTNYRPFIITVEEANYRLQLRNHFYNYKRKHTWLGMDRLTPIQKLMKVTNQIYETKCHLNSATTLRFSIKS